MVNETLAEKLKFSTQSEHQETEKLLVEKIRSIQSAEDYIKVLKIFYGYFSPVEKMVRQHITATRLPDIDGRRNTSKIEQDLKVLGYDQPLILSPALPDIRNEYHAAGAMYVQEGSTLGGRHIARMISSKLENASCALTFFQGYNEKTEEKWEDFKDFLNRSFMTESEQEQVIEGAKSTFEKMRDWILQNNF